MAINLNNLPIELIEKFSFPLPKVFGHEKKCGMKSGVAFLSYLN